MAKEVISQDVKDIKKAIEDKNIVIGTNLSLKYLKLGRSKKVYISNNCDSYVKDELDSIGTKTGTKIVNLSYSNEELGVICGKPFSVSLISIPKD